jgi:hypothetical protein
VPAAAFDMKEKGRQTGKEPSQTANPPVKHIGGRKVKGVLLSKFRPFQKWKGKIIWPGFAKLLDVPAPEIFRGGVGIFFLSKRKASQL